MNVNSVYHSLPAIFTKVRHMLRIMGEFLNCVTKRIILCVRWLVDYGGKAISRLINVE